MKSKFQGVLAGKAAPEVKATRAGRPKGTSADSTPITLHLSAEYVKQAKMRLLQTDDKRPLSTIVDALLERWVSGNLNV